MNGHRYLVKVTTAFRKDYKRALKRGLDTALLDRIVTALADGRPLPPRHRDHALTGGWIGWRECHIQPNWLLVYLIEDDILVLTLTRTGSHSDLFGN